MPRCLPLQVRIHLEKARESALLAVETYNRPSIVFRSGGFIVLMCIAWTALFHAIFLKKRIRPFYRDKKRKHRYERIEGDYRAWELGECVKQYYGGNVCAERVNIEFFIPLRNKIEHSSMPSLDVHIFGECQAFLFNFEDLLFKEFGAKHAMNESLSLALQFSHLRDQAQTKAVASLHRPLAKSIKSYMEAFRSSLSSEILNDLCFSYKVFLIPKTANHLGQSDVAVEFVKYDPSNPKDMDNYEKLVSLIKPVVAQVANAGRLKAGQICKEVEPIVQKVEGPDKKFNASYHHVKACYFYKIRARKGEGDARKTRSEYCQYDEAHGDYVYTGAWKDFLINEMKKPGQYKKLLDETQ